MNASAGTRPAIPAGSGQRRRGVLAIVLGLAWLISCNKGELIHEYQCDVSPLEALSAPVDADLRRLPVVTRFFARDGLNVSSRRPQSEGLVNWVEIDVPQRAPHRTVTAEIRVFDGGDAAKRFMGRELTVDRFQLDSRTDKYRRGVLPNGVEYGASYIHQDRADPEGCSGPMESYRSFLMFRSGTYLVLLEVIESRPQGVTADDTRYVVELLRRSHSAP